MTVRFIGTLKTPDRGTQARGQRLVTGCEAAAAAAAAAAADCGETATRVRVAAVRRQRIIPLRIPLVFESG